MAHGASDPAVTVRFGHKPPSGAACGKPVRGDLLCHAGSAGDKGADAVFPGGAPSRTEELAIILFTKFVLLCATVGVREQSHIVIETIPARWSRLRSLSDRTVAVFLVGFGVVALISGINYVQRTACQKSAALSGSAPGFTVATGSIMIP